MKVAGVACLVLALAAAAVAQSTILATAAATPDLSTLAGIVTSPGYEAIAAALDDPAATLTLFAPNNAAFAKLPAVPGYDVLYQTLLYHVLPAVVGSGALTALQFPATIMNNQSFVNLGAGLGQVLEISVAGGTVSIVFGVPGSDFNQTAVVTVADVVCSNGVVHIIDTVLLIPSVASTTAAFAGLDRLVEALTITGLAATVDGLTGITIFAPSNDAFDAIPGWQNLTNLAEILTYHVATSVSYSTSLRNGQVAYTVQGTGIVIGVNGGAVTANDANVVLANALIQNGVVHVIDKVLIPPVASPTKTILENAIATPQLSALVGIVSSPGYEAIAAELDNEVADLTLFAPNNAAFAKLAAVPGYDVLFNVLLYHVLSGGVAAGDLLPLQFPETLMDNQTYVNLGVGRSQVLEVSSVGGTVSIVFGVPGATFNQTAVVTVADVVCSNGIVHIIDTVLLLPTSISTTASFADLTTLVEALVKADLVSAVDGLTGTTVFAPTNAAFAAINWEALSIPTLTKLLTYHVIPSAVGYSTGLTDGQKLVTLEGTEVTITTTGGIKVNDAAVVIANALVSNGVVHVIDKVLFPEDTIANTVATTPGLSTLASIVTSPGYEAILAALNDPTASLTLFAPSDAAFAKLPSVPGYDLLFNVLLYHVLPAAVASGDLAALQFPATLMNNQTYVNLGAGLGQVLEISVVGTTVSIVFGIPGQQYNQTAVVTIANVPCTNGIIHVIDTVLLLPSTASNTAVLANLLNLVEALTITGLANTVDGLTGITIFAPTDAAFDAIPSWQTLPNLAEILSYHIVTGVAYSTDLSNGQILPTVQGENITVTINGGSVKVNSANVVLANALIKNGAIHVIDQVLSIPSTQPSSASALTASALAFVAVVLAIVLAL